MDVEESRRAVREGIALVREEATDLLRQLVATPSITGDEGPAQQVVAEALGGLGLEVDSWFPTRAELVDHESYSDDGPLAAHLDEVFAAAEVVAHTILAWGARP